MAKAKSKSVSDTLPPTTTSETSERDSGTIVVPAESGMIDPELSTEPGSGEGSPGSDQQEDQQSADDSNGPGSVKAEKGDENDTDFTQTIQMPVQKRRRVTRACDECRRKKIKCDGKQPCTHCSVYSYECTYDKPSNRRRNPAPQYIEALEQKLARAESLLRKFVPDVDLNDPNLDPSVRQEFQNRERQRLQTTKFRQDTKNEPKDAQIMSMIETLGQLDLTEGGGWDFRGTSSGAVFLRRMKDHFRGLLGHDYTTTFLPRPSQIPGLLKLDLPLSTSASMPLQSRFPSVYELPPKERARQLSYCALNCATVLLRIVHIPSFFENFEKLYDKPTESFGTEDNRFLGLLYAVMAVGCIYNIAEEVADNQVNYKEATEEGMKYYTSARVLIQDITECRDLTSLHSLLFLLLFLQATSNLSACYAFLGIATRIALRMGLHRHLPNANFTPPISELRRRTFYFIRQLDIYCSAVLGFPILLHDEDIDQELPTEVDDGFITASGISTPPSGTPGSFFQAFNAHSRLMRILMKVIKYIYPLKGIEDAATNPNGTSHPTYMIDYQRIKEIEGDLQEWHEQLPQRWRPSAEGPIEVIRVRTLLRFAYAHVQMMLYRPFLHYISPRLSAGKVVDDRYYACAAAGISVCRNIIHIAMEIKNKVQVIGPYWSMLYSEFFAILTLVFYTLENPEKQGSAEIYADANAGREMIAKMAPRSFAADRITTSLSSLWQNLPESLKNGKTRAFPTRKRSAPWPKPGSLRLSTHKPTISSSKAPGMGSRSSISQQHCFDKAQRSTSMGFTTDFPELHLLDVSSTGEQSDASGTPSSGHPTNPYLRHSGTTSQATTESPSHLYKLDAMMFPSGDPFAYPTQPLMDYREGAGPTSISEAQPSSHMPAVTGGPPQSDSRDFYMPSMYGDIEGHLMGPLPPYLMQPTTAGQNGLDLSAQMYHSPSSSGLQLHHGHQHPQHRVGREMDDMMTDVGFNRSWDIFGGSFKPL